ncbi:DMT family transporter [Pelagovum pacificum]|uniref:DMT family transporter n=1 Tax=Pelagovum pacificum TaxID=2588711 RepID=A0A5C5GIY1_9RHOB|nr:DMT family transporter [Pelagovum pacificum]QQA43006.1 DMT family transporter [Pelagovum pacificum]TNY33849.1 DMT family transporter [Pelagovum pacificum]
MQDTSGAGARATISLTLAALFWSGNFIAGRALGGSVPPLELNVIRWLICLALLLPFTLPALVRHRAVIRRDLRLILLLGLTGIAGFHTLVYQALRLTPAVNALLILSLAPVVTVVGGAIWNGFRPSAMQIAGLVVSAIGALVILLFGSGGQDQLGRLDTGTLWMLAAIVVWAAYSLLLRRRPPDLPQDVTLAASIIAGLAMMVPFWLLFGVQRFEPTFGVVAAILYIGIFASLLGFLFWSWGLARIGPERAGQFIHLMPVFGAVLAVVLLGERLLPAHGLGAALAVCGIVLVNRRPTPKSG